MSELTLRRYERKYAGPHTAKLSPVNTQNYEHAYQISTTNLSLQELVGDWAARSDVRLLKIVGQ
jgi:hypothetical protein